MARHNGEQLAHHAQERLTAREITSDVVDRLMPVGSRARRAAVALGLLFLLGAVAFAIRLFSSGPQDRAQWGYLNATFAYLLTTVQAGPLVAIGLRFVKADWRRPLSRPSELFAVAGILSPLLYIPLLPQLPSIHGRRSIWFDWPFGAPWLYDTVAVVVVVLLGLAILWVSAIPDFATMRDHLAGPWRERHARLALGWVGTPKQWTVHYFGLVILGAFYAMFLAYVHLLVPVDFAMSLIPGWVSAIFPAYHMLTALQSAVAINLVAMYLWRRWGGLDRYLGLEHFWGLAKILLALSLLWFYMWWADFLTLWYGRTPREQAVLQLLIFGPYFVPWLLAIGLSFLLPFLTLIFNRVRVSVGGPVLVSMSVLVGNYFERVREYVSAFTIEDPAAHEIEHVPPVHLPDVLDLLMIVGVLAGAALLYMAAAKAVPPLAMWEVKEGLLLRVRRRFLKGEFVVLGKPR